MPETNTIPVKFKIISGSGLKLIAVICMLIDHYAAHLLTAASNPVLFVIGSRTVTLYYLMRSVGRLSFPIFCFLIVEGFLHTHDRKKYAIRMLVFALISEIPWDLVHVNKVFNLSSQNVFFTLLLGFLGICAMELFREDWLKQALCLLALFVISLFLHADYGCTGYGFIIAMYCLREHRIAQAVVGCCFLSSTWRSGLAFIPINLYNGKRGFIKGKIAQLAFYAIYPVHLFVFYLLKKW